MEKKCMNEKCWMNSKMHINGCIGKDLTWDNCNGEEPLTTKEAPSSSLSSAGLEGPTVEWIDAKEKLPEESPVLVRYIGQFFGEPDPRIDIGYYDNPKDYENPDDGQGWLFWRMEQPITVTHWMKLPELPKAD